MDWFGSVRGHKERRPRPQQNSSYRKVKHEELFPSRSTTTLHRKLLDDDNWTLVLTSPKSVSSDDDVDWIGGDCKIRHLRLQEHNSYRKVKHKGLTPSRSMTTPCHKLLDDKWTVVLTSPKCDSSDDKVYVLECSCY